MTRTIRVVGMGMGPDHLTPAAARALEASAYVVAPRKHRADGLADPLLDLRAEVCRRHGLEVVEVDDPPREKDGDYGLSVASWHADRLAAWDAVLASRSGDPAWLVWGDPSLYDSNVRILRELAALVGADLAVEPGVSAPSLLAARHQIVLHGIGDALLFTTGRRLAADIGGAPNVVVMLDGDLRCLEPALGLGDHHVWWGANLGTPSERLVAGRLEEVADELRAARDAVRAEAGWVLDTYLLTRGR